MAAVRVPRTQSTVVIMCFNKASTPTNYMNNNGNELRNVLLILYLVDGTDLTGESWVQGLHQGAWVNMLAVDCYQVWVRIHRLHLGSN